MRIKLSVVKVVALVLIIFMIGIGLSVFGQPDDTVRPDDTTDDDPSVGEALDSLSTNDSLQTSDILQLLDDSLQTSDILQLLDDSLQTSDILQLLDDSLQTSDILQLLDDSLQANDTLQLLDDSLLSVEPSEQRISEPLEEQIVKPLPFSVGERLEFKIYFEFILGGTASMSVEAIDTIDGYPCYRIASQARSTWTVDRVYKVRDRIESYRDVVGGFSRRYVKHLREGGHRA
ncbi:MAG: DUF3108 domain-containing protein, partial [Candidatus Electryoneaceae bacterium]|nr:DUF3108 domain-containing protein [Candidatus Electryoneaceae bacterium]